MPPALARAHIRIARPTDSIEPLRHFYCTGLGFDIVSSFKDHNGFDGLMVGLEGHAYHLEFTRKHGHDVGKAPTEDNLLVFYLEDEDVWKAAIDRMEGAGYLTVQSFNPWWDAKGKTFEDADGYRVVLWDGGWTNRKREAV